MKTIHVAEMIAQGGRDGNVEAPEGGFAVQLSTDEQPGSVTPEHLFAGAYAACFSWDRYDGHTRGGIIAKAAAEAVTANAKQYKPDARLEGVLVQQMASGLEVIVGGLNDACFGPTVVFGLGGIFAEVLKDVTYRFAPFGLEEARRMIDEIKAAVVLKGYRGREARPNAVPQGRELRAQRGALLGRRRGV